MLTHIVLFKLQDRSPAALEEAREILLSMEGKIPQLLDLEVGIDILHSERSYDIALVTKFNSLEEMQAYQVHPLHVQVSEQIKRVRESSVAIDYELG